MFPRFAWSAILLLCLAGCSESPSTKAPVSEPAPDGGVSAESPWLVDVTAEVGIDFVHDSGAAGDLRLPEIMGSGVALFDADGDGRLDIYLTNGGFEPGTAGPTSGPNRLYIQQADGTFADRTAESGAGDLGYGMGVAVGDYDNDGDNDLYVTNYGRDRLYRNDGSGRFEDATTEAGIVVDDWSCSAAFCDYDGDGFLDLYVTRYVQYDPEHDCSDLSGRREYCAPTPFEPAVDVLLHNDGDGTFSDATAAAGIDRTTGPGLGVVCEDFDEDGRMDFYVANDLYPNQLWVNRGGGRFEDQALARGVALNFSGKAEAGMGVVAADLDQDRDLDLFMTHLAAQTNTLYRNLGSSAGFEDATGPARLAAESLPFTGFGTVAADLELDGDLDLIVVNGRVVRATGGTGSLLPQPWNLYAEPNQVFLNRGDGAFDPAHEALDGFTGPVDVSRGLAVGDIDNDGDLDLVLGNLHAPARVYRNEAPREGGWLILRVFDPRVKRDAIGARVTAFVGGRALLRTVSTGVGYLSAVDPRVHFGLGREATLQRVEVVWPDGLVESFNVAERDSIVELRRGEGNAP